MADGKVIIDTQLNSRGAEQGVSKLKKSLTGIGNVAKTGLGVASKAIGAASTAVTAFGGYAVKAGMDFEAGMSKVGAISGAGAKDMEKLTAKAKEMGAKTKFSATESAEAMSYMAMAGWKAGDMLNGIEGIMNLAAASGEDLAATSDIVTDALTAFGLTAKDSGRFADVLAQASSNANTNVGLMGETFKYVAPVAGALGYSAEDTAVAIGLMANSGIKASQAGTSLRALFTNLAKPSKSVQVAMDSLNISLTDSAGKIKPLNTLMVEMREKFKGLTEEQKAQYAASLAGKTGMSGLLAIVNSSDKDFDKLTKSINNSNGAAEKMAGTMQNNLSGQITILKSSIEGLAIEIYDSFNKQATKFVESGTSIISGIVKGLQDGDKSAVSTGINDLMSLIADGIIQATPTIINAAVEIMAALANGLISNTDGILNAVKEVATNIGQKLSENTDAIVSGLTDMIVKAVDFVSANLPDMVSFAIGFIGKLVSSLLANLPELISSLVGLVGSAVDALVSNLPEFGAAAEAIIKGLGDAILNGMGKLGDTINKLVEGAFKTLKDVAPWTKPLVEGLEKAWKSIRDAWKGASDFFSGIFNGAKNSGTSAFSGIQSFITNVWKNIKKVWDACAPFFEKIFLSVGSIVSDAFGVIQSVARTVFSAIRPMVQKLQPLFESVFGAAKAVAEVVFPAILSIISKIWSRIAVIVNTFRPLVEGVFKGAWNAVSTIWNVATSFFSGIFNHIKGIFTAIKSIWTGDFKGAWNAIKGVFANAAQTFFNIGKDMIQGLINGVKNMAGTAVDTVKNVGSNIISGVKGIFGIHSPSRVFKEIGEYTMKGFEIGLVDASGSIIKKTTKTFSEIIKQAEDTAEQSIKHYEDLVKSYNDTAEQINKNNAKRKEILKKQAEEEEELKLKASRKLKDLEKDLHSTNEKTRKSASEKAKKIQTDLTRAIADNKRKSNKEIDSLEKEQTKLVEKAEKQKTQVKKAEQKARLDASKAYYSDEAKELLSYYDDMNKTPSLVDRIKEEKDGLKSQYDEIYENLNESLEKINTGREQALADAKENYEKELSEINETEQKKLDEMENEYAKHFGEVEKTWNDSLEKLKTNYEKDLQAIVDTQEKYSNSILNFTGLFDAVKTEDVIDADTILTNAAAQTSKVEKYYEDIEKLKSMNLPEEIVEQFKNMGVNAADQLEVFVNMSTAQIEQFVAEWQRRKAISDKLAEDYYAGRKEQLTAQYNAEKAEMERQRDEELEEIKKTYEEKVKVENDQWKETIKRAGENYAKLTAEISSAYDRMYQTEIKKFKSSMWNLQTEAVARAKAIGEAIKAALADSAAMSAQEAQGVADSMTDNLLSSVRSNLDIHSPSRVFAGIADLCLQGFEMPFKNYNPVDVMRPSVNSVINSVNRATQQQQPITTNNTTTNAPVLNFYDSAVSPDAVYRQFNKTMRYGLAGGMA